MKTSPRFMGYMTDDELEKLNKREWCAGLNYAVRKKNEKLAARLVAALKRRSRRTLSALAAYAALEEGKRLDLLEERKIRAERRRITVQELLRREKEQESMLDGLSAGEALQEPALPSISPYDAFDSAALNMHALHASRYGPALTEDDDDPVRNAALRLDEWFRDQEPKVMPTIWYEWTVDEKGQNYWEYRKCRLGKS